MPAELPTTFALLQGLLKAPSPQPTLLQRLLPSSGTLPQLNDPARRGHRLLLPCLTGLRSLAQVIFINNPLSGGVLILAFLLESPWMALLALVGTASANFTSSALRLSRSLQLAGIHGFNGGLVGCAAAVLGRSASPLSGGLWLLLVMLGSALTTVMVEAWGRRFHRRGDLPPLTLPFCLVTWALVLLAAALSIGPADPAPVLNADAVVGPLGGLLMGLPRSFGQVFLCSGLGSGLLVLLAVALASPLAAGLGLLGAGVAMGLGLLQGADPVAVAQGLWGYNGVLVAIAIGGIFHAPSRRSLLLAICGAALTALLAPLLASLLIGLPPLTLNFVLTTWLLMRVAGRHVPALIPVCLHAVLTPEEHLHRYQVARKVLGGFRTNLRRRCRSEAAPSVAPVLPERLGQTISKLFGQLDRDGDGSISLAELRAGLSGVPDADWAEPTAGFAQQARGCCLRHAHGMAVVGAGHATCLKHRTGCAAWRRGRWRRRPRG